MQILSSVENDGIGLINKKDEIIYLNEKGCSLLDIDYDSLTPSNIKEKISEEMKLKNFQNLLSKKYRKVFRVNGHFVGTHDFSNINIEIENDKGAEELVLCRFRDITDVFDRKEMEEYLYSDAPIGVFKIIISDKFKFLYGSPYFYTLNGIENENKDDNKFQDDNPIFPEFLYPYIENIKNSISRNDDNSTFEIELQDKNSSPVYLLAQCTFVKVPKGIVVYGFVVDNTFQKMQEMEMQTMHQINKFTIEKDYLNVVILDIINKQYQIIATNQYNLEIYPKGDLGQIISLLKKRVFSEDRDLLETNLALDNIIDILKENDRCSEKIRFAVEDKVIWTLCEAQYYDEDKNKLLLCMRDIDEEERQKKRLVAAMQKAESANRAKSDFLSRMSHDIRTPLNTIIGMTSLSSMHLDNAEKMKEYLKKIDNASRFLLSIINDVLDMSKIESGKMDLVLDDFNFKDFISSLTHICYHSASQKGIDFNVTSDPNLVRYYYGDQLRLRQILMNLLSNAIKFTAKEKGYVALRVDLVRHEEENDLIRFTVSDNGVGISEEFRKRLFKPFEQESENQSGLVGTGLGLSITHSLVKIMNGTIRVISSPGEGSRFIVEIPLRESSRKENDVKTDYKHNEKIKVLIIDDDEITCRHTHSILTEAEVETDYALSGKTGIDMINKAIKDGSPYNLIIVDWKMPEMDGNRVCKEIRKNVGDNVLIFIMSAFDWTEIEEEARENGVNHFISKPMFRDDIHFMLQSISNEPGIRKIEKKNDNVISFNAEKILLVEDNEINAELLKTLLECFNLNITVVSNGEEAVNKFASSSINEYRIILMDIRMPVMNGYEATRIIRNMNRDDATSIPIFALSANAFAEDIESSIKCGMNEHLCKPIDIKEITRKIKAYINK